MSDIIVIDNDILGWGKENKDNLLKLYKEVRMVGSHPNLNERDLDHEIATYCIENNCDLMTGDIRAYDKHYKAGVHTVQITDYDWWETGRKRILLIKIIELQ
tara:strand:+ start:132 stop:437 length:306 start_codon:yes stop_codon:yes gene_type:complete